ncbi:MAG TPA: MFS transporter [Rhodospirillales bacterium]|jgi:MFS family permease|nr:MFS transporter [Rhodospirillales bacterium]
MQSSTRATLFINIAHFVDHFALLIFPTAVLVMGGEFGADYGDRILIATGSFLAFGVLSLPAGWLGDKWSRRHMMAVFFIGIGAALFGAGLATSSLWLIVALGAVGCFGAIYHPVGMAMLVSVAGTSGRVIAWNGVYGNLGVAFAAITTAAISEQFGWRVAFMVPGAIFFLIGISYHLLVPADAGAAAPAKKKAAADKQVMDIRLVALILSITVVAGGFTFNGATIILPKLVIEEIPDLALTPTYAGLVATGIYMTGALTQVIVGRLIDHFTVGAVFVTLALGQSLGFLGVAYLDGQAALMMAVLVLSAVYGQVIVNDLIVARTVPDQFRARAFAARYVLGFAASASVVPMVGWLYHPEYGLKPMYFLLTGFAVVIALSAFAYAGLSARKPAVTTG